MSLVELKLFPDSPLYEYRTTLSKREYRLRFDYSEREDRWYLRVKDADGALVLGATKIVCGRGFFARRRHVAACPAGELIAIDRNGTADSPGESPGFYDLGRRVRLFYITDSSTPAVVSEVVVGV